MYLIFKTVTNSILDFAKNFISIGENSMTKWVINTANREKISKNTI